MAMSGVRSSRRRAAVIASLAATLVATAVTIGALGGVPTPVNTPVSPSSSPSRDPRTSAADRVEDPAAGERAAVAASADPIVFATAVSRALFGWDTTAPVPLGEVKGRLLPVADPTGVEAPGLVADLARYLPTAHVWEHLRRYQTRQWLEVTAAAIPETWTAAIDADPGLVAPGTFAVTITGVRHRGGVWDGEPVTARFDVAFTVFVVCGPTYPTCYLLRLTQLDKPLN